MLALPGSASVDELRVMLAADMFIMTEAIAGERVTNGIVTRSITTWLSDREHARQVPPPPPPAHSVHPSNSLQFTSTHGEKLHCVVHRRFNLGLQRVQGAIALMHRMRRACG